MHIRRDSLVRAFEDRLHQANPVRIEITSGRKAWIVGVMTDRTKTHGSGVKVRRIKAKVAKVRVPGTRKLARQDETNEQRAARLGVRL